MQTSMSARFFLLSGERKNEREKRRQIEREEERRKDDYEGS